MFLVDDAIGWHVFKYFEKLHNLVMYIQIFL